MKVKTDGKKWLIPILLVVFGMLNIAALDVLDVMKSKNSWLHAGMPQRPAWSQFTICKEK